MIRDACSNLLPVRFALLVALLLGVSATISPSTRAQISPASQSAFRGATVAMREGRLEDASNGFQSVVEASPNFAEAHFNLGLVYQQQARYKDAIESFSRALKLKPRLHGANLFLGLCEYRLNQYAAAATALEKEVAAYPKEAPPLMWLGVVRLAQERPEEAAEALDKAAKLDPGNSDILYHRGKAHLLVSKDSYTKMFELDPKSWRVHEVLAQTDAESEHHDEAVTEFLAAIKLAPNQPGLREELGSEYRMLAKIPEAENAFKQELEIDPNNVLARYKLGVIEVEKNDAATGKQLIEEALKVKPGLLNSDYNLGRAEMELGNNQAAADLFKKAIVGNSEPEIVRQAWYQLGTALRRMNRTQEAQQAFAEFQKLKDEEAEDLQRALSKYKTKTTPGSSEPPPNLQNPQ